MDMKNLAAFVQVAELHSFTKAAAKLGFSQSTISFQIRQLEAELDTRLFDRINHTVVLTEKGKEVLGYAYQILQLTQKMTCRPRRMYPAISGLPWQTPYALPFCPRISAASGNNIPASR